MSIISTLWLQHKIRAYKKVEAQILELSRCQHYWRDCWQEATSKERQEACMYHIAILETYLQHLRKKQVKLQLWFMYRK